MMFLLAYPAQEDSVFCRKCLENTQHSAGVAFSYKGFSPAWRCNQCGNVQEEDDGNPFDDLNKKLDKLLAWSGHGNDW